ncbi:MAG: B12-binding domain-containing radical SAM protein [Deltaproteobacteria bacterium]|nr:B12-binding domain-containing radical SAM protein [Deltaproteobacteria bacterium]
MKICFVQKQLFPYFGIMSLSGVLKQQGHETDVLISASEPDFTSKLRSLKPDLVCFSVMSTEHRWLKKMSPEIKQLMPQIPIVVGGIHATMYPMDVLKLDGVDYVCRGEGEVAFPSFIDRLERGEESPKGVQGMGYYENGVPTLQGVARLPTNLDSFKEDRAIYYNRYSELRNLDQKIFMSSRGCPFDCAFCSNSFLKKIFKTAGRYIRRKSPRFFIEEIKQCLNSYGSSTFFFCDDLFVFSLKWLEEFCQLYRSEINVPFICTGHAKTIKERHAKALAEAGCHTVSFGVETGNERLRRTVLNKNITNADLLRCSAVLKNKGIELQTSNMFCLPDETIEDAVSTIDLNIRMGTDYMFTAIFLPFPGTRIAEYCIKRNLLKPDYSFDDLPESFVRGSVLLREDKEILANIHKVAHLCLIFPKLKAVLLFLAKNVRSKHLFFYIYLVNTFLRYTKERKLTYLKTLKYLWTYRKGY